MVEAVAQGETREQIRERIKGRFMTTFDAMDQHEVKITEEDGNIEVRQTWDENTNVMMGFGQQKMIEGLVPDDFRKFFEEWDTHGASANDTIVSIDKVATDNGVDTMKVVAAAPWPISNRVMFSTRYLEMDIEGGHMILFCSDGNDRLADDPAILTPKEKKKLVVATVFLSGWWVKPIKDESGAITGTNMKYFS